MSKRLLLLCAAVLMMAAFTGAAMAADAVTVYVEPASKDVVLYQGGPIQARAVFLDAAGQVATTYGGAQIGDSVLELKSANYAPAVTFDPASPVNIDNSGVQEFTITYNPAAITELGDDIITATLKKGSSSISNVIPVKLLAPQANTYAVRTGLSSVLLPEVLESIPAAQNNNDAINSAGSSVNVTVLAAFGRDTVNNTTGLPPQDGLFDTFIFTDNVPAGGESVSLTGQCLELGSPVTIVQTSGSLVDGKASVDVEVKDLKIPDLLEPTAGAGDQSYYMNLFLNPTYGVKINWGALGAITREVGNGYSPFTVILNSRDVNADNQVVINPNFATLGFANSYPVPELSDNSTHKPAPLKYVTIIGLPANGTDGLANQGYYGNSTDIAASDAYNLLLDPKQKPATFLVNAGAGPLAQICGAIVGFDQFNNPAPFLTSGTVPQFTLSKNDGDGNPVDINAGGLAFNVLTWYDDVFTVPVETSIPVAGVLAATATLPYTAFMPFQIAFNGTAARDVFISDSNLASDTVYENVDTLSEGVTFNAAPNITGVTFNPATPNGFTAGDDDQTITVNGTADEKSFVLRAKNKKGVTVKLNTEGQTTPKDNVPIPLDDADTNTAEGKVVYFTKVNGLSASENVIFYVFEGKTNKTLLTQRISLGAPGILPADPGDFPPSGAGVILPTVRTVLDTDHREIQLKNAPGPIPIPSIILIDAFGNSYTGNATLEDADPTLTVVKADGTTPYPGADAEVNGDFLIVGFNLKDITADSGDAKVKIVAGAGNATITYKVRALKQTALKSVFIPLMGNDGQAVATPVKLNFADQSGMLIAPVVNYAVAAPGYVPGSYEVDLEAADGTTSLGDEFTLALTTDVPSQEFTATLKNGDADKIMTIAADGGDADAGKTTLTLDFNADFEKPVVGAVTAGACSISVAITDNKAVNLAGSTVVVKNGSTGEDITSTLTRTDTGDGTTAGSINFTVQGTGSFVLEIVARDKANNTSAPTTRMGEVTSCIGSECVTVDPAFVRPGETKDVIITGSGTNFVTTGSTVGSSSVNFSCAGITVNSTTANSATELTVNITVAASAAAADCEITVTTGGSSVTCDDKFAIVTTLPSCSSVSPASVDAGFTGDVTVTLADINLTGATGVAVDFGCSGVTVNSSTVTGATTVKANITVAEEAAGGSCDVTVTGGATGSLGVICKGAFTVVKEEACTITVAPTSVSTGFFFPRTTNLTITGAGGCEFDSTTTVTISGSVEVQSVKANSATKLTVTIQTRPVILGGKGTKTVTVKNGAETVTGTFTVKGLFF